VNISRGIWGQSPCILMRYCDGGLTPFFIRLDHNQLQNPLYDIEIQNVEEIRVEKSKLIVLKQQSKEPVIELNITPNFMLDLSI
jgi:hypothetical protein